MLGQRLRRWPNIDPTLVKCTMFERKSSCPANARHLYDIYAMLVQHCIKSYKCFVFTGWQYIQVWGSSSFQIPAVMQSVCLQVGDQVGAKTRALNYYLIDGAQVYMNLLWFENFLLMRLWVWNAYLVLFLNRALAHPRALLPSGGPLSREFWQLTTPLNPHMFAAFQFVLQT